MNQIRSGVLGDGIMRADLHVHTCLSPCADVSMTPDVFVEVLRERKIDLIAITDHNSTKNVRPFKEYLERFGFMVVPGIEITSVEEVHVLGYFKSVEDAERLCEEVYAHIPDMEFDPERFGYQIIVDSKGNFVSIEEKPLFLATNLSIDDVVDLINEYDGIPVYAHVDRAFGVEYQLGIIPDLDVRVLEVRRKENYKKYKEKFTVLTSSDAHVPDEIGSRFVELEGDLFDSLKNGKIRNVFDILI